jgi:hypothetical protein
LEEARQLINPGRSRVAGSALNHAGDTQGAGMNLDITPASRTTDRDTSWAAGDSMGRAAATHRALIWAALKRRGPMGRYEIAEITGLDPVACARRLSELVGQGICRVAPARRETTPSGRAGSVWEVCA